MNANASNGQAPVRILIVDDNEQNVELLQAYMEEVDGAQTETASNGIEALSLVAKQRPSF